MVHLQLNDNAVCEAASTGASVLNMSADRLLRASRWPGLSLDGVVDAVQRAAARRGLGLYVMMPFHRPLFELLAREGVATVQDYDVAARGGAGRAGGDAGGHGARSNVQGAGTR